MLAVLVPFAALAVVLLLTTTLAGNARVLQPPWVMVGAAALIATALHPTGRDFFRSFGRSRVSAVMAVLVAVAAVPLLVFATTNARLQGTAIDDHAAMGHYGFMAAFALTTIGVGLLASVRPDGWRVTAWVAGLLPVLLGLTSLGYPAATSSLSHLWALTAIVWGVIFVVAAEHPRVRRAASTTHTDPPASR